MSRTAHTDQLAQSRKKIAAKVRELRQARGLSQADVASRLDITQGWLSQVERGIGSLTAEQFLELLRLFNASASDFATNRQDVTLEIQNALARLGAAHLHEAAILPSAALEEINDVVREALVDGSPRVVTALAPVIASHAHKLNLSTLYVPLHKLGLAQRLGWVLENTLVALDRLAKESGPDAKAWKNLRRRAEVPLELFLGVAQSFNKERSKPEQVDILDPTIRSARTLEEVTHASSEQSRRWSIATSLQPDDFVQALRASRAVG